MTKFKKQNALPCKFQKKFKGPLFHCREISDHKYWWSGKNLSALFQNLIYLETWSFFRKTFDKSRFKVGKIKISEFQKMYVRRPGNRKHSFFINLNILSANWLLLKLCNSIKTNVWYLRSLENWPLKCGYPFNFAKNLKDRNFVVGGSKNLKLLANPCFGVCFQKKCIFEFSAIFVCLLSRWPKR